MTWTFSLLAQGRGLVAGAIAFPWDQDLPLDLKHVRMIPLLIPCNKCFLFFQNVACKAAMILHHLSKSDAALAAMAQNPELINAIIQLAKRNDNSELTRYAAGTLYNISRNDRGVLAIFQSGGIPVLVRLLR